MTKKSVSNATPAPGDPDSFWLASIAWQQAEKQLAQVARPVAVAPAAEPASSPVKYQDHSLPSADNFWLKYADARYQESAAEQPAAGRVEQIMDMRVGIPESVAYNATLQVGKWQHAVWAIRNMSLGGVFLEMGVNDLREGTVVEFQLRYQRYNKAVEHLLPAKVVRVQLNGLALQFGNYDAATSNQLHMLLYSC